MSTATIATVLLIGVAGGLIAITTATSIELWFRREATGRYVAGMVGLAVVAAAALCCASVLVSRL
ncbi:MULTISPECIES: hypothetical protein [unclassified Rathayibacter]|uniref:hypothetical protein n=1 Tax=unclassified Rathayibacter TaxID=2609250 RepID=UPI000CE8935A|nr:MULTISPECIES: hypothetical protein [unclassified Rathayibacter]PPF47572.1 hypothetical protein C5E14_10005 [Rathayibacter sp. AY1A1]PPH03090.1 hypothetical protein C5C32_00720 [Rathayibacter sp. AY1G9]